VEGLEPDETILLVGNHEEEIGMIPPRDLRRSSDIAATRFKVRSRRKELQHNLHAAPRRLTFTSACSSS